MCLDRFNPNVVSEPSDKRELRTFAWEPKNFRSVAAFREYVFSLDISWAIGCTIHHTWRPTKAQWQGRRTMDSLRLHYLQVEEGSWDSGPNIFIAPDGIWQGTPLTRSGIHAGKCNKDHFGIEVVGDYDVEGWSSVTQAVVFGVVSAIFERLGLTKATNNSLNGHRECLANKSCPGRLIDMDDLRQAFNIYQGQRVTVETKHEGPPGTSPTDERMYGAWSSSGGVWRGPGLLAPGYATSMAYEREDDLYQVFERGIARRSPDGNVEWLLLQEILNHNNPEGLSDER